MEALELLKSAQDQVAKVLDTSEKTFDMLQKNIIQVREQRIGLMAQKQMLDELVKRLTPVTAPIVGDNNETNNSGTSSTINN